VFHRKFGLQPALWAYVGQVIKEIISMASFKLWVLGSPHLEVEDAPVEINRQKAVALLIYLAVTSEKL
jgi:hypothetical protein